jgi:hypothetical protein
MELTKEVKDALADLFPVEEVFWKPQAVKGSRAMAIAYIDARAVMDRLDDVVGPGEWSDSYRVLNLVAGRMVEVECTLTVCGVSKADVGVGTPSFSADAGENLLKGAYSDALKRAAVKFGIGRYLYSLPKQWVDWDEGKRQFVRTPQLPAWAIPKSVKKSGIPPTQPDPPVMDDSAPVADDAAPKRQAGPPQTKATNAPRPQRGEPQTVSDFLDWYAEHGAQRAYYARSDDAAQNRIHMFGALRKVLGEDAGKTYKIKGGAPAYSRVLDEYATREDKDE